MALKINKCTTRVAMTMIPEIFLIIVMVLCGCNSGVKVDYYKHEATHYIRKSVGLDAFEEYRQFVKNGVLFVPDFSGLTTSYTKPLAFVGLYSDRKKSIYIQKAVLLRVGDGISIEKMINKNVALEKVSHRGDVFFVNVVLFDHNDKGLEPFRDARELVLQLHVADSKVGPATVIEFKLNKATRTDVNWPT